MRSTGNAPTKRAKRGSQGGNGRGQRRTAAIRTDADADLSSGEREDAHADGALLGHGSVVDRGETGDQAGQIQRYSALRLKAEAALEILITANGVPANVRASAVRTALELVGAIGVRSKEQRDQEDRGDDLDPERLSIEDIDREIGKLGRV
jgi:hypothetical protein